VFHPSDNWGDNAGVALFWMAMQTFFIIVASLLSRVLSLSVRWQRVEVQAVFAVSLLLCGGLAQAQTALVGESYRKTNQLITAKNYAAALQAADAHLTGNPRDPQMRLIRSRVLIAQGKTDEARSQLLTITQEFPEIAEPYNNLAVLYAQSGELEMARAALESALRINPQYVLALHNMGDVYRQIAEDHYRKALALQPGNRVLQEKIRAMQSPSP
jgi:tetratricopeptide (TPR) repeat protein